MKGGYQYWFYCPGCKHAHGYTVGCEGVHANWTFEPNATVQFPDGTTATGPTFNPSLRVYTNDPQTGRGDVTHCHLFVTAGKIVFCNDCPHELNGQTVDLPDFPDGYGLPEPNEVIA